MASAEADGLNLAGGCKRTCPSFFMGNYAERSSFGENMGPLFMVLHVWCDKDGAMDGFLWKLWASSMCT